MSEPFFPPPQKKEERGPYREPAPMPVPVPADGAARGLARPRVVAAPSPSASVAIVDRPPSESFVRTFLWRFGVRVAALGIVIGLLKLVVALSEGGAKWPQAIVIGLGVIGILASPFVFYFRARRLWRFLFARNDDG